MEAPTSSSITKKKHCRSTHHKPHKPPVPSRNEKPVLGLTTNHNFITENAVNVILSSVPNKNNKDTNFMKNENFGKIPEYLHKIKEDVSRENQMIDDIVRQKLNGNREPNLEYSEMDDNERIELLSILQKKWDDVNRNYQKICHRVTMETPGDIRRKESQEAELKQLEMDIEKLSKPGPIMIKMY